MIRLQDIDRVYNVGDQKVYALNQISLQIAAGEYVSIMGPSGSGKSTLLHILGLLDRPSSGQYLLDNEDILSLNEETQSRTRREKIGFVFQFFHLIPRLSAAENIALPMVLAGIPAAERKQRVDKLLRDTALQDRARHRPDQLSGGQQQRVAIARAMVMSPAVLLADEPTGNLDRSSGNEIIQLLEQLNSEGLTLIVVTHDHSIGSRARRQIQMEDGKIISDTVAKTPQ